MCQKFIPAKNRLYPAENTYHHPEKKKKCLKLKKKWPKLGQNGSKIGLDIDKIVAKNEPRMVKKWAQKMSQKFNSSPFWVIFLGLNLGHFGSLVAWEGLSGNQKCKKIRRRGASPPLDTPRP